MEMRGDKMKVIILAGGFGTRLSEETDIKPKPLIEIGGRPVLWHIMKIYSHFGFNDFIICLGYKGYLIKEYFHHYFLHQSDVSIDFSTNSINYLNSHAESWKVTLIDTGLDTLTGGRIKRIKDYVDDETFMVTYGDGVSNIDIKNLLDFHSKSGKLATLTAVQPSGRYGALDIDKNDNVIKFQEKPKGDHSWVNGGFYVFSKKIFDHIENDMTSLESDTLQLMAKNKELSSFRHYGFWKPMDTLRDKNELENLWEKNKAQWKVWE